MNRSTEQAKIAPALVAALGEIKNPAMGGVNPHFKNKYAKLHDILAITRPTLLSHGLCAMQDASGSVLLLHTSGEWIEFPGMPLTPSKNDPQGHVAALTYARRAYLTAALGICGDEDDDGNTASSGGQHDPTTPPPAQRSTAPSSAPDGTGTVPEGFRFAMDDFPHYKPKDGVVPHVFGRGPDTRWNGWTWGQMASAHREIVKVGGDLGNSPLEAMFLNNEYIKGWNREQCEKLREIATKQGGAAITQDVPNPQQEDGEGYGSDDGDFNIDDIPF